ncbi:two-component sensor histidine kinase [Streptomyces filipinensis]|uniref:histidine kinase n=1 Tax=Streptomyces filipinensis TaxID=66887 RepID=A0A918IDZ6_9ACTN|nr:sensor histidine kinase [Streptomyces filipinensis]GGV05715.1 two-component sensor histidine kinase [Streptomyces filipinensis]
MSAEPENPAGHPGDAPSVTSPASPVRGEDEPVVPTPSRAARFRAWLGDNPSSQSPPFSKYRWLRLLTYLLTFYAALAILGAGAEELSNSYGLTTGVALLCTLLQATAVVLALWRPVPAWALSLAGATVTALLAREQMLSPMRRLSSPNWPWSTPVLLAHMAVLLLLALRVRVRGTLAALGVTAVVTSVVEGVLGALRYSPTGYVSLALFAVAVLIGTALRSRSEARTELVQQTTITAEERARRTLLEERSRIARELHDVVAHHMSVISIQAQVAPHLVENPTEELKENLTGIRNNALEALTELRRVLGVLRSESPDEPEAGADTPRLSAPGTGPAPDAPQPNLARLDSLLENTRAAGVDVVKAEEGDARGYSPGVELSAYRIVQEALSNVLRHAPGARVRVDIAHFPNGIYLSISNTRPSRPVQPSPGGGHGLLGMRERAAMLGGNVEAKPTREGGFVVTAFLPRGGGAPEPFAPEPFAAGPHRPGQP